MWAGERGAYARDVEKIETPVAEQIVGGILADFGGGVEGDFADVTASVENCSVGGSVCEGRQKLGL